MKQPTPTEAKQSGFILILTLIQSLVVLTVLTGVMTLALYNLGAAKRAMYITNATYAAEAGADRAMYQINQDDTYTGTNTSCPVTSTGSNPVTLYNDTTGRATYETCVVAGSISNEKIVYAVGKVYVPASSTSPKSIKTVRLIAEGTPAGTYSVQTGPGGLTMINSATITIGPILIGGFLNMNNTARIGSAAAPVGVDVANMRCPTPVNASWPQICSSGTQDNPITMNNTAHIYGDVQANGQINTSGLSNGGLVASSGVPTVTLPDYDRASQKAAVTSTLTSGNASCSGSASKSWAANVHVTGDVTTKNSCTITISGNAWIDGNLTMNNTSTFKVADTATTRPTVMVDGSSGITLNNQVVIATNAAGIGIDFITFYSGNGCSPDCGSVTGPNLNTAMGITTINIGNQGLAPNSTFYARWSGLTLGQSGNIGSILAQAITLNNTGNITFGSASSLSSIYSWDVRYYETL